MQSTKETSRYMLSAFSKHKNHHHLHSSIVLKNGSNIQGQQGLAFSDDSANSRAETSNDSESSKTPDSYYNPDEGHESEGFKLDAGVIRSKNSGVDPSRFLNDSNVIFEDVYNQRQRLKKMHEQYSDSVKKKFPYTESIKSSNRDLVVEEKTREQYRDYGKTHFTHFSTPNNQSDQEYSITAEVTKFNDPKPILNDPNSAPLFAGKSSVTQNRK